MVHTRKQGFLSTDARKAHHVSLSKKRGGGREVTGFAEIPGSRLQIEGF